METVAREAWRESLEGWGHPEHVVRAHDGAVRPMQIPSHPGRPTRAEDDDSPTVMIVEDLAEGGSILDVGAGTGRHAVLLAGRGHRVTAVESDSDQADLLRQAAAMARVSVTTLVGAWPVVARNAGRHDVVLSAHAAFEVSAIGPFVAGLHAGARRSVVVELTGRHPFAELAGYYRRLHGVALPTGPSADAFADVVAEVTGVEPERRWWTRTRPHRFADLQQLLAFYRSLLVVPPERSIEAAGLLEPDVRETGDGWLVLGSVEQEVVTMWWRTADSALSP